LEIGGYFGIIIPFLRKGFLETWLFDNGGRRNAPAIGLKLVGRDDLIAPLPGKARTSVKP